MLKMRIVVSKAEVWLLIIYDGLLCFFECLYRNPFYLHKNSYVKFGKHVRLFPKTRTCFPGNIMMFLGY